jgi:signal peptidase II
VSKKFSSGFIVCVALIFAGALGNLIDSLFYGIIFDRGMLPDPNTHEFVGGYSGLAEMNFKGYSSFLHGNVVDMLYVPIIENKTLPDWIPFWGGENFTFFSPIFNIADASISIGVIAILLFQKRFFPKLEHTTEKLAVETNSEVNDTTQIS